MNNTQELVGKAIEPTPDGDIKDLYLEAFDSRREIAQAFA